MSHRRVLARNALWTAAGMASSVVTGFISAPFLIHRLGQTTYGLWILIAAITSYFNLIDLGLRASITRHVAFFRAKHDQASLNAILSTAQMFLLAAAVVTMIVTLVLMATFTRLWDVPPPQLHSVRLALLLSGLTLAITLAMSTFDATLWAYERFDLINCIEIVADVGQTIVLLYLIWRGGSLLTIASILLVGTICNEIAKAIACFRIDPKLRIIPTRMMAWAAHELFSFGLWKLLWSMGIRATSQSGPLIIGARVSANAVTPYSVGSRLVGYARGVGIVGTNVVTPTATAMHAEDLHLTQQKLFIEGGKFCLTLSLFLTSAIILLGRPFISCWLGLNLAGAATAASILAWGEMLPMSQWITYSILMGRNRHRVVAVASVIETLLVLGLGLAVAKSFGIVGVCLAVAIPGLLGRGILPILYGCRVLDVSPWRYVTRALVPPILAMAIPAAAMQMLVGWHQPQNWLELFSYGGIFSFSYLIACCALVIGPTQLRNLVAQFKTVFVQFFGSQSEPAP